MCPERGAGASPSAPTPHQPVRGQIPGQSASSAAVMSATATTRYPRGSDGVWMTSTTPRSPLPEPLGQNTASRCPHSPNGHSVGSTDRHHSREANTSRRPSPRKSGVSPNLSDAGDWLPGQCLRSSGQGGTTGRRSGRTPRLPDEIPVTPEGPTARRRDPRGRVPTPRANLAASSVHRASQLIQKAPDTGREGSTPARVYPPLPRRSPPITRGIYRGRGPLYPAEPGRAPRLTTADSRQQATTTLPAAAEHTSERDDGARTRRLLSKPLLGRSHRGA